MSYGIKLIGIALCAMSHFVVAAVPATDPRPAIEQFIKLGGMQQQFDQLPSLVRYQLENSQSDLYSVSRYATLSGLFLEVFGANSVKTAMSRHLLLSYNAPRYRSLMKKLNHPVINDLLELELLTFQSPLAQYEMEHFNVRLKKKPIPSKRIELIKELISTSGNIELQLHAQSTIGRLINELMITTPLAGRAKAPSPNMLHAPPGLQITPEAKLEATTRRSLFVFRDASDDDIKQLIRFYNSSWGNWFKQIRNNAWSAALHDLGRDVAWKLDRANDGGLQTAFEEFDI